MAFDFSIFRMIPLAFLIWVVLAFIASFRIKYINRKELVALFLFFAAYLFMEAMLLPANVTPGAAPEQIRNFFGTMALILFIPWFYAAASSFVIAWFKKGKLEPGERAMRLKLWGGTMLYIVLALIAGFFP